MHARLPFFWPGLQAHVTGVNKALEQYAEAEHKGDVAAMIALQPAIKFNGGGAMPPAAAWAGAAADAVAGAATVMPTGCDPPRVDMVWRTVD